MSLKLSLLAVTAITVCSAAMADNQRATYNFNSDWQMLVTPQDSAEFFASPLSAKVGAQSVTLPHAWNEDESYRVYIHDLSSAIVWYYKSFVMPQSDNGKRVYVEFEGARQSADIWLNGHKLGFSENGVMAFGFDLTPYIKYDGENQLVVRCNNDWNYRERLTGSTYQWNNKNFNVNMGGLNHNVRMHVTGQVFQTLPLYDNLGTVGTYIYGTDYDISGKKVTAHAEAQVINATDAQQSVRLQVQVTDPDGNRIARFSGKQLKIAAGDTVTLSAAKRLSGIEFWSWGYGYLYNVQTELWVNGQCVDALNQRTGFRKTSFGDGKIYLNDRCFMVHGYAQRTSNEWPALGTDFPAWMSDYSNHMMVESGGNTVRWMHITPSKQEVESCDRVGLIQALPAGDAEKDAKGRQWEQRTEVMRSAIIYNRNNPSVIFYESGNESISREHMIEMVAIRDKYDPHGGRAIGSREMLDIQEAEYGGEMLYTNKSGQHPVWAMEYCRDEAYRMYWDNHSYPYHQTGAGGYYKRVKANDYNRNQDDFCIELIRRWYDYYLLRPGMGKRVSSGGVKIIFSDTNTHGRSEMNYRVSGVVDPLRIPKEAFYVHQLMWRSWVDIEHNQTYIIGHWNHIDGVVKDVYVASTEPAVELFQDGKSLGKSTRAEYRFLHTFKNVTWKPGTLRAIGYDADGKAVSEYEIQTVGRADHLKLSLISNPLGMKADGSDIAIVQVEVVDAQDRRCPLDNRFINWTIEGPGEWRGGVAKSQDLDNFVLSQMLPVEAGVNRVLVRSTTQAGTIRLTANAKGLASQSIEIQTEAYPTQNGRNDYLPQQMLPCRLELGPTPSTPSYTDKMQTAPIISAQAGANNDQAKHSFDDNELSEWRNDGKLNTAWITYTLQQPEAITDISIKLTGWRKRSYPLEVYAGDSLIWKGDTPKSLGYCNLHIDHPVKAQQYTIRQTGSSQDKDAFGQIVEVAVANASELDLFKQAGSDKIHGELRIVEIDFLKAIADVE